MVWPQIAIVLRALGLGFAGNGKAALAEAVDANELIQATPKPFKGALHLHPFKRTTLSCQAQASLVFELLQLFELLRELANPRQVATVTSSPKAPGTPI